MTTTETIFGAWLFLLTLSVLALFAGWMSHRGAFLDLAKIFDGMAVQFRQAIELSKSEPKQKRQRRTSKADTPIAPVPTWPERAPLSHEANAALDAGLHSARRAIREGAEMRTIDLSTPLAERVAGVGGTKPEGDGEGGAA